MSIIYQDNFTVLEQLENSKMLCTSWNNQGGINETLIHRVFLEAYKIEKYDSFSCFVDANGSILVETITKVSDEDDRNFDDHY